MSPPALKWGMVRKYFIARGYEIKGLGGDKIIKAPPGAVPSKGRSVVRIGHRCCNKAGDELLPCYISSIRRAFGVTRNDILNNR